MIQITAGGAILVDGVSVTLSELQTRLKDAKARDAETTAAIRGDELAQYSVIVAVIDLCDRLHMNTGLVTARVRS